MLTLAQPTFLLAGLAAALIPLLLHLLARRPPAPVALPTARFLRPDTRSRLRFRRRPSDPLLLVLRMLLLILLGAGLAGLRWIPPVSGTAEIVLLEQGAGMRASWEQAVAEARRRLTGDGDDARGTLVLFDSAATVIPPSRLTSAFWDSLLAAGPTGASVDYAAALRAMVPAAREADGVDSVRAALVSALRAEGWMPGLVEVRRAAWSGSLELVESPSPPDDTLSPPPPRTSRGAVVIVADSGGVYAEAALGALGWDPRIVAPRDSLPDAPLYLVLDPPTSPVAERLMERLPQGATLLIAASVPEPLGDALPWRPIRSPDTVAAPTGDEERLVFAAETPAGLSTSMPELVLRASPAGLPGRPTSEARTVAVWGSGRPAAAAVQRGDGCIVFLAASLAGGVLPTQAEFPRALERLVDACGATENGTGDVVGGTLGWRLDAGARQVLEQPERPAMVARSRFARGGRESEGGRRLSPWLLAAALGIALIETLLVYGRRQSG